MIAWPANVNQIIRQETTWSGRTGIIRDTMRSGRTKTRLSTSSAPKSFSVVMIFNRTEYALFETWFEQNLHFGALTFQFPKIAGTGNAEYQIISPFSGEQFGRDSVKITMSWEEV